MSTMMKSNDSSVRNTNDDATSCKRSAVKLGYYNDPFISHFMTGGDRPGDKKSPLINRGYYARVYAFQVLINKFLDQSPAGVKRQIVSLGAGFDSLYWRLKSREEGISDLTFVEVDFEQVTIKKCGRIRRSKELTNLLAIGSDEPVKNNGQEIHAVDYHLLALDLRDVDLLAKKLHDYLDFSLPTLFITECVLIYLPPEKSDAILDWIGHNFTRAALINYEQIHPNDPFGGVMLSNLQERECPLLGIHAYPTLQAQVDRMTKANWTGAWALDMATVYNTIPQHERDRVNRLEMFDEYEEWHLILSHYCMVWAWIATNSDPLCSSLSTISL